MSYTVTKFRCTVSELLTYGEHRLHMELRQLKPHHKLGLLFEVGSFDYSCLHQLSKPHLYYNGVDHPLFYCTPHLLYIDWQVHVAPLRVVRIAARHAMGSALVRTALMQTPMLAIATAAISVEVQILILHIFNTMLAFYRLRLQFRSVHQP